MIINNYVSLLSLFYILVLKRSGINRIIENCKLNMKYDTSSYINNFKYCTVKISKFN
jgi:hypothetical protein